MNRFYARFDSECEACFGLIVMGDQAGYMGSEVWCDDCLDTVEESGEVTLDDM